VLLDGQARCACLIPVGAAAAGELTTIEGLRGDPVGECLVQEFRRAGAVQCGFCTPGFLVAAWSAVARGECADADAVTASLAGNLCRCTGYAPIRHAVAQVADQVPPRPVASVLDGPAVLGQPAQPAGQDPRFLVPAMLEDAHAALARLGGSAVLVAGGTHVMAAGGLEESDAVGVWLGGLAELSRIESTPGSLRIGAAVSWARLRRDPRVARFVPALAQAAARVGGPQIQEAGTLGGNLVNAAPGADGVPPLAIHRAEVELSSAAGTRRVPVTEFAIGPGATLLRAGEILTAVEIPVPAHRPAGRLELFVKVGPRRGRAVIDKVSVAVTAARAGDRLTDVRIALGAAGPTVLLASEAARLLMAGPLDAARIAAAGKAAAAIADPIDDIRPTADHRRRVVAGLLVRELSARLGIPFDGGRTR
jgi:xanthine dehydrogenase iron-sulfur cluster and FAD-binding subunit A